MHKDPNQRRKKHTENLRNRYRTDPVYRERHKAHVANTKKRLRKECRELVRAAKAGGCQFCSEREPCCLALHHVDPVAKSFELGRSGNASVARIKAEIAKCLCLCMNCHAKVHAGLIAVPALAA